MSVDSIALYIAAGRTLSPWLDWAVWFALKVLPGIGFILALLAAWAGLATTVRAIHSAVARRTRWHISDLENYANDPDDPRFARIPARKED